MSHAATLALACSLVVWCAGCKKDPPYMPDYTPVVTTELQGSGDSYEAELFPMAEGNSWTYLIPGVQVRTHVVQTVAGPQRINEDTATIVHRTDASLTRDSYLKLDERGLWDYGTLPFIYASPVPRLLFPVKVGKKWHMSNETTGLDMEAEVVGIEQVLTPAGSFDTIRIRYLITNTLWGNTLSVDDWWLAPSVGLVKREGYESSRNEDMEFKFLNESAPWVVQEYNWLLRYFTLEGR